MNKFALHTGQLSVDTSTTMNYDIKELMSKIVENHATISWEVMGCETKGIIFVSLDEEDKTKIICHGSMVNADYSGEQLSPENYLWVMIDKVEASFRARFLTPEAAGNIEKSDFTNIKTEQETSHSHMLELAERLMSQAAHDNFMRGVRYGMLFSAVMIAAIAGVVLLCV